MSIRRFQTQSLVVGFVAGAVIATSAAIGIVVTRERQNERRQLNEIQKFRQKLVCAEFWQNKNGIADAKSEFNLKRRGLFEITFGYGIVPVTRVPGLRDGASAEIRPSYQRGRKYTSYLKNGPYPFGFLPPNCDDQAYALDFNVTMLRLLKRQGYRRSESKRVNNISLNS